MDSDVGAREWNVSLDELPMVAEPCGIGKRRSYETEEKRSKKRREVRREEK